MAGVDAAPSTTPAYRLVDQGQDSVTGICGNVVFRVHRGEPTLDGMQRTTQYAQDLIEEYPDGIAKVACPLPGSSMPSPELRQRIAEASRVQGPHTLCMAMIFAHEGTWAGMMRMVANTMMVAIPSPFPRAVFGDPSEASIWLFQKCSGRAHFKPEDLIQGLKEARSVVEQQG